jgi:hypothetical protein
MLEPFAAITRLSTWRAHGAKGKAQDRRETRRHNRPLLICFVYTPAGGEEAQLMNLSAQGACLVLDDSAQPGTLLRLHLSNPEQLCSRVVTLRVSHCTCQAGGHWMVGGPFVEPLLLETLYALIR